MSRSNPRDYTEGDSGGDFGRRYSGESSRSAIESDTGGAGQVGSEDSDGSPGNIELPNTVS